MNKDEAYKILDIKDDDTKENIKAKLGLFRLKWLKKETNFSSKQVDEIGDILSDVIGIEENDEKSDELIKSIEKSLKPKGKFLINSIKFILFFILSIYFLIFLWNVHIVLGIIGIVIFFWFINNKYKTGYYFGK